MSASFDERVFFDAELRPNRSLSPRGFVLLMGAFVAFASMPGLFFLIQGAWPVVGFFGLEGVLLWLALRRSFRDGEFVERVRLTERGLSVRREPPRAPPELWQFEPTWLRVSMDDPPRHESQVTLSSHGRSLVVGACLTPEERLDFARALRAALQAWRERRWE